MTEYRRLHKKYLKQWNEAKDRKIAAEKNLDCALVKVKTISKIHNMTFSKELSDDDFNQLSEQACSNFDKLLAAFTAALDEENNSYIKFITLK